MNENKYYIDEKRFEEEKRRYEYSLLFEGAAPVEELRPESDNPLRDTLEDIRMNLGETKQKVKHGMQNVQQVGASAKKGWDDAVGWIKGIANNIQTKQYNEIKEDLLEPNAMKSFFKTVRNALIGGSLFKAGLLLNPLFIVLGIHHIWDKNAKMTKIRNEIITEVQTEIEILQEKIDSIKNSYGTSAEEKAKMYKMMRAKNELQKKLWRAQGGKVLKRVI